MILTERKNMNNTRADQPAIRAIMMPRDTNHQGNIFGGVILAYIDQAGFVEAKRQAYHTYVTASVDRVDFLKPIFTGDTASFYTKVAKVGTTSITIDIEVFVESPHSHIEELATTAKLTYVALDERTRRPMPVFDNPEEKSQENQESS
jgi:acyl-CoA thioesterase YciA